MRNACDEAGGKQRAVMRRHYLKPLRQKRLKDNSQQIYAFTANIISHLCCTGNYEVTLGPLEGQVLNCLCGEGEGCRAAHTYPAAPVTFVAASSSTSPPSAQLERCCWRSLERRRKDRLSISAQQSGPELMFTGQMGTGLSKTSLSQYAHTSSV